MKYFVHLKGKNSSITIGGLKFTQADKSRVIDSNQINLNLFDLDKFILVPIKEEKVKADMGTNKKTKSDLEKVEKVETPELDQEVLDAIEKANKLKQKPRKGK
jgi:hypothetical protein